MKVISTLGHKFPPPPFITTPVNRDRLRGSSIDVWRPLINLKYGKSSEMLTAEFSLLREFMVRKGPQLRLEKAMMLTNGISKLAKRWKQNNFHEELMNFKDGFSSDARTETSKTEIRFPSYQWLQWTVYVLLRDATLLAKIKIDCERTIGFWLGMIASSHHWGDSLIISSIIARIWHLASVIVEELSATTYPFLLQLNTLIEPLEGSVLWPKSETGWGVPDQETSLVDILSSLGAPFQPANLNRTLSTIVQKENSWLLRVLDDSGNQNSDTEATEARLAGESEEGGKQGLGVKRMKTEIDDDDHGVPVTPHEQGAAVNVKKKTIKLKNAANTAKPKPKQELRRFKEYWEKFFKEVPSQLPSKAKRKQLIRNLRQHTAINAFGSTTSAKYAKLKVYLIKLRKVVRGFDTSKHSMSDDPHDQCLQICAAAETFLQKLKVKRNPKAFKSKTTTKEDADSPTAAKGRKVQQAPRPQKIKKTKPKTNTVKTKKKKTR